MSSLILLIFYNQEQAKHICLHYCVFIGIFNAVCFVGLVNPGERLDYVDKTESHEKEIRSYRISKYLLMID